LQIAAILSLRQNPNETWKISAKPTNPLPLKMRGLHFCGKIYSVGRVLARGVPSVTGRRNFPAPVVLISSPSDNQFAEKAILPKATTMVFRPLHLLILLLLPFVSVTRLQADEVATTSAQPPPITGFQVLPFDANIAPTISMPTKTPEVVGHPKNETGHPSLIWDQDDIDHYKAMLKTSKELQIQFDVMKAKVDERIAQPVEVPAPQKGPNGGYRFIGDAFPAFPGAPANEDGAIRMRRWFAADSDMISDIATIYVLTGDEKYGDYAKQLLLAWSHCYEWGPVKSIRLRSGAGAFESIFVEGSR
jgi:hypothetical protein